jgi:hypothetical protein
MSDQRAEQVNAVLARYREEHNKLHVQWSATVGTHGYVKQEWMDRAEGMTRRYRSKLDAIGYTGPLLLR